VLDRVSLFDLSAAECGPARAGRAFQVSAGPEAPQAPGCQVFGDLVQIGQNDG